MLLTLQLLLAVGLIVWLGVRWRLHPFLALLCGAITMGLLTQMAPAALTAALAEGFGSTLRSIGIVIAAGAIIGEYLERSGGAQVLANRLLARVGERRAPLSMGLAGYVVSIPVFCDSGFIVLSALNRAIAARTGIPLPVLAVALACGLYTAHVLVPPTPGPLAAAATLGADLGWVLLLGVLLSVPVLGAGLWFATGWCGGLYSHRLEPALGEAAAAAGPRNSGTPAAAIGGVPAIAEMPGVASGTPAATTEGSAQPAASITSADALSSKPVMPLPSLALALLPIFVPIVLIALRSIAQLDSRPFGDGMLHTGLLFMGDPIIALLSGVLLAMLGLHGSMTAGENGSENGGVNGKGSRIRQQWLEQALNKAGSIILITGAGGAFAAVLRSTELDALAAGLAGAGTLGVWLPFVMAALLKTAQGSSTVAIITAAAITAPLLQPLGLDSEAGKALAVLAVGAGAMTVSHVNDSYFWVVARFSDMDTATALRTHTLATLVMGLSALLSLQAMVWLLL